MVSSYHCSVGVDVLCRITLPCYSNHAEVKVQPAGISRQSANPILATYKQVARRGGRNMVSGGMRAFMNHGHGSSLPRTPSSCDRRTTQFEAAVRLPDVYTWPLLSAYRRRTSTSGRAPIVPT
ncbi:hypothetical protein R1flu_003007 [Riccia fluitans]|uniref:Uncharacterized protein n=1 Tax=Riccia fluitans TaxID=41844 RepID=A0ABD1YB73_9MARC